MQLVAMLWVCSRSHCLLVTEISISTKKKHHISYTDLHSIRVLPILSNILQNATHMQIYECLTYDNMSHTPVVAQCWEITSSDLALFIPLYYMGLHWVHYSPHYTNPTSTRLGMILMFSIFQMIQRIVAVFLYISVRRQCSANVTSYPLQLNIQFNGLESTINVILSWFCMKSINWQFQLTQLLFLNIN